MVAAGGPAWLPLVSRVREVQLSSWIILSSASTQVGLLLVALKSLRLARDERISNQVASPLGEGRVAIEHILRTQQHLTVLLGDAAASLSLKPYEDFVLSAEDRREAFDLALIALERARIQLLPYRHLGSVTDFFGHFEAKARVSNLFVLCKDFNDKSARSGREAAMSSLRMKVSGKLVGTEEEIYQNLEEITASHDEFTEILFDSR